MIIDALTGDKGLRRIRDRATDFARRMYDPSVYNPQADQFRRQASQGIEDDLLREDFLGQLYRQQPQLSAFGGNQAAAIAGTQLGDLGRTSAISDFERNLATQELQAMERGRQGLAGVQSQQLQVQGQRDAAIAEADMTYQAEKSSRRQALLGQAINLGAIGMTGAFAPGMAALKGSGLGALNALQGNTSTSWFDNAAAFENIAAYDPGSRDMIRQLGLNFNMQRKNEGGTIEGPDVDADIVPAMLTPGEEVINAESAEASRDLLKLINENPELAAEIQEYLMSMGIQNFNDGGTVKLSKENVRAGQLARLQSALTGQDTSSYMSRDIEGLVGATGLSQMDFGPKPTAARSRTSQPATTPVPVPSMNEALPEVPELLRRPSEASVSAETQSNQLKNPNTLSGWERMGLAPFGAMGGYIPYDKVSYDNEDQREFMQQQIYGETGSPLNAGMLGTAADFIVKAPWRATKFAVVDPIRGWFESSSQNARTRQRQEFEAFMQSRGN
jgi:hypothetical protein